LEKLCQCFVRRYKNSIPGLRSVSCCAVAEATAVQGSLG
jgi:hypothetical protein